MTQDSGWNTGGDALTGSASYDEGTQAPGSGAGAAAAGHRGWASPGQEQPSRDQGPQAEQQPYGQQHYGQPYGAAYGYGYGPAYAQWGYPPTGYYGYPPPRRTNVMAIVAIALCVPICLVGMILGFVARKQIQDTGEDGDGIALAAIIVGAILTGLNVLWIVGYILLMVWTITSAASVP